ncbi:MAG: peptide deformylase [bacterium]
MNKYNQLLTDLNDGSNTIIEKIPELTYIGNPVLRTKAEEVSFEEGIKIGKQLLQTLLAYKDVTGLGVGLAAPQIGIGSAVFVTYKDDVSKIYINPKIISTSEETNLYKENCLSSGHVWCDVRRPKVITLSYVNEEGKSITEEYNDFWARLLQHEYDHLLGIVNVDKATVGTIDYRFGNPKGERLRE